MSMLMLLGGKFTSYSYLSTEELLQIPNLTQGINACLKLILKSCFYFQAGENYIKLLQKFGDPDFKFSQFVTKQWNRKIQSLQ